MEHVTVEAEWYLAESDDLDPQGVYIEPQGMVETALNELGAIVVAVDMQLPEPA